MQARPPTFDARGDRAGESDADGRSARAQTTLDFAVGMSVFLLTVAFVLSFAPSIVAPFSESGTEDTVTANRVASDLVEGTLADPDRPYVLDKGCTIAFFAPENADGVDNDEDLNDANDGQLARDRYDISTDDDISANGCNFQLDYLHERLGVAGIDEDGNVEPALSPGLQIEIRGDADGDGTSHILCIDSNGDSSGDPWDDSDPDLRSPIVESPDDEPFDNDGDDCDASSGDYDIPFQVGEDPPEDTGSVVVARRIVTIDGIRATVFVRVW